MDSSNSTRPCKKCGLLFSGVRCNACNSNRAKASASKARMTPLTADRARKLLDYDCSDGRLYRRGKPKKERTSKSDGRYTIFIDGVCRQEHRVVWLWHYGEWPKQCIDHIDRTPLNNRIENLRDVTLSENKQNQLASKNNATGLKGVCKTKVKSGAWTAQICHNGKNIYLGYFKAPEDAHAAYCEAAARLHTCNPLASNS